MTQEQFDAWLPDTIATYAGQHVATGRWSEEESLQRSRDEHARLLPQGLETPGHNLWNIVRSDDNAVVGLLWIQLMTTPRPFVFIYNIEIHPEFRRRGYAEKAMLRLEGEARRMAAESIRLHVFGHNTAARPLYEKLGYLPTNINMAKTLS